MSCRRAFLALGLGFLSTSLHAGYGDGLTGLDSEDDYLLELPVVLSATRMVQPVDEAPVATSIIDRELIEASGYTRIADLFRLVPGMQVMYESGNDIGVAYHGLSDNYARRMQVLIDGRSVYTPSTGGVPWADLPIDVDDIERIEVVRGANAATYGANAFQGVINIITRHPAESIGEYARLEAGNQGYRRAVLRHGGSSGDLDYRITASYNADDGFSERHDSEATRLVTARFDYQGDVNNQFQLQMGLLAGDRQRGSAGNIAAPPHERKVDYGYQSLTWQNLEGFDHERSLRFSHQIYDVDEPYRTAGVSSVCGTPCEIQANIDLSYADERFDLEYQQADRLGDQVRLVWAANARLDRVRSKTFFNSDRTYENRLYRLFGHAEWRATDKTLLNIGGIVENDDLTPVTFSPRIAVNHEIGDRQTLRLGYSTATRTPVLFEEFVDEVVVIDVIDPPLGPVPLQVLSSLGGLKAEKVRAVELGYMGRFLANTLEVDGKISYEEMRDLIGTVSDTYQNLDSAWIRALELELRYRPDRDTRILANYAHIAIDSSDVSNEGLEKSAPANTLNLMIMKRLAGGYRLAARYYHADKMKSLTSPDITGPIDSLDASLGKSLKLGTMRGKIRLNVLNVLNNGHAVYRRENIEARRIQFRLDLSL